MKGTCNFEMCMSIIMIDPLISVIVPAYNIENYIVDSVDSILNQSYKNLEVLIVDDGSTDNTGKICDEYAAKDSRVKVFHVENGGTAHARNIALDNMNGEYVAFVDGDDYLNKLYLEILYSDLVRMKADISTCCYTEILPDGMGICSTISPCDMLSKKDALKELLYQVKIDSAMWAKLFKSSLFTDIRFPEGNIYADIAIIYKLFEKAHRVSHNTYGGYYYFIRVTGMTLHKFIPQKMDLIENLNEMSSYLNEKFPELNKAIASRVIRGNFHIYLQIPKNRKYRAYRKKTKNNIRRLRFKVITDSEAGKDTRIALGISYFSFNLLFIIKKFKNFRKYKPI